MLKSAQNFAAGFFGIPTEEQYNLEVMIEWPEFNCTLAPYYGVCQPSGRMRLQLCSSGCSVPMIMGPLLRLGRR